MKVLFVVPDGIGLRNYLYSTLIDKLSDDEHEIVVWHALPNGAITESNKRHHHSINWQRLPKWKEAIGERLLRDSSAYARLLVNAKKEKNPSIMEFWTKRSPKLKIRVLQRVAEVLGYVLSKNYDWILAAERKRNDIIVKSKGFSIFLTQLEKVNPDVVFCTHQRAVLASPALLAAKRLEIRSITAIFSWDNLPKGRMAVSADRYAVWSSYMKNEMARFYPEIDRSKVIVTGTPQFEFYKDESLFISKEEFAKLYKLDTSKKWICYSGDDQLTSPHDPKYLEDFLRRIDAIDEEKKPQIILRKAPVDKSGRFEYLEKNNVDLIVIDPLWTKDDGERDFSSIYPTFEDARLLVNLARHCDAVVNVGSTMAHDFAQFDKPAYYINYDVVLDKKWSTDFIYRFQHFRSMGSLNPVEWINSSEDWGGMIEKLVASKYISNDRKKWFDTIHTPPTENSTRLLAQLITSKD